jgi:raffinose/stachyose/melibiose transport system permease protein
MKKHEKKVIANKSNKMGIAIIVLSMLISIIPIISMISAALAPQGTFPKGIALPVNPNWHNFIDAWKEANILELAKSSSLIVVGVVPIAIFISTLAAYAIVVLKIPGGKWFGLILLLTLTLPFELNIVPLYYELQNMGLLDNRIGLCLALIGLNMPFSITWMQAHFNGIPYELTEAASIDGAGPFKSFISVQLPLALPAMAANTMLMFLSTWNNFLLPLVLITDPNRRTMAGALQAFVTQHSTDQVLLNAGALLLMAPTILIFLALQKYFVAALLQGSVKG